DALVRHDRHGDEPRVLQPRGEESDALRAAVDVAHVDLPEVVLRELAGEALEANDGHRAWWPEPGYQGVERRLATGVTELIRATQQLLSRQLRLLVEP